MLRTHPVPARTRIMMFMSIASVLLAGLFLAGVAGLFASAELLAFDLLFVALAGLAAVVSFAVGEAVWNRDEGLQAVLKGRGPVKLPRRIRE